MTFSDFVLILFVAKINYIFLLTAIIYKTSNNKLFLKTMINLLKDLNFFKQNTKVMFSRKDRKIENICLSPVHNGEEL